MCGDDIALAPKSGSRIGILIQPVKIPALPCEIGFPLQDQRGIDAGALVRCGPGTFGPWQLIEKAVQIRLFQIWLHRFQRVYGFGLKQLQRGDAMRGCVKGMVGRFYKQSGIRMLQILQGLYPGSAFRCIGRKSAEHIQDIGRIGAAVFIEPQLPRPFLVLPDPAGIFTGMIQLMGFKDLLGTVQNGL